MEIKNAISEDLKGKIQKTKDAIVEDMNYFYSKIDVEGQSVYSDIFGTKDKIYSGSEATEFHLAKMFAFAHILNMIINNRRFF